MTDATKVQAVARIDPQALLTSAIDRNATVETLERLVDLAKTVKAEQARSQWYEAISEFQGACPEIKKKSEASIFTAKGSYRYKYAELPEIMATVRPLLRQLGLSVFWRTKDEPGKISANCFVAHTAGHVEESGWVSMPLPDNQDRGGGNPLQRAGSALSYARRYSLMAILGIAPEDDDDAQSAHPPKKPFTPDATTPPNVDVSPGLAVSVTPAINQTLPTVDWWKTAYAEAKDADSYKRLEKLLEPEWPKYDAAEHTELKFARDKAKTRFGVK